jgi:hypothetical protein
MKEYLETIMLRESLYVLNGDAGCVPYHYRKHQYNFKESHAWPSNRTSGTTISDGRCGKMVSIGVELLVGLMVHRTLVVSPLVSLSLSFKSYTRPSSNGRANKTFASQNEWFLEQGRFSIWTSGSAPAPEHNPALEVPPLSPQTGTNITQYFIRSLCETNLAFLKPEQT